MSVDTADFNNDLILDMYIAQISGKFSGGNPKRAKFDESYCSDIRLKSDKLRCLQNIKAKSVTDYSDISLSDIKKCKKLFLSEKLAKECMVHVVMSIAIKQRRPELCNKIPNSYSLSQLLCEGYFKHPSYKAKTPRDSIEQITNRNVLLRGTKQGDFLDVGKSTGALLAGWSWNAKFADLDNDEYQDIYVANGTWTNTTPNFNVFFHNEKGQRFVHKGEEFGLADKMIVGSYTYIDYDDDGDLDIISLPVNGPIKVFRNNEDKNRSIKIKLRDRRGNRFGIGAKIYVYYGKKSAQIREIKAGGEFHSFEAPVAHFGLGEYRKVTKIVVVWADGKRIAIKKQLPSGNTFTIVR